MRYGDGKLFFFSQFLRKLSGVMINSDTDEAVIVNQIVDPIGDGKAIS